MDTAADDVALLGPTSGSTGVPKITMHFHRDILSIDNTFGRHVLRLAPDDVVACTAPLAFTFGLGMLVVFPLRAGACALLTEQATPAELADIVASEHGVTVLATAPTAYKAILRDGLEASCAGLRTAVSAGEHIPQDTWERLRDEHRPEGHRRHRRHRAAAHLHLRRGRRHPARCDGQAGARLPRRDPRPRRRRARPGRAGRLGVIGPVGCRYLDDERQRNYVVDGWNITGDTFYKDEDGYFYYQARTDNMIVSSGYNIGGPEVEAAIDTHPDVVESAVVARPDAERGSVVCAFVVLREGVDAATPRRPRRSRTTSRTSSRRTSTRATSGSSPRCRATPAASCSTSSCGRWSRRSRRAPFARRSTVRKETLA